MTNGQVMADGEPVPKVLDTERIRSLISSCLELVDGQKVPFVRNQIEQGREEGREEGRHKTQVDDLLIVLRHRGVWLSPEQNAKLQNMRFAELPTIDLAFDAANADEFVRLAGL